MPGPNHLVVIQNGLFSGRETVSQRIAIQMISDGLATPADPVWREVKGYPDYTFSAINLTFKAYDKIVNAQAAAPKPGKEKLHAEYEPPVCIPSTQKEEVYRGNRKQNTDGPVTGVVTVLRKVSKDGREFINWDENETFRPGRRNEDQLPWPMFSTEKEYLARQAELASA